MVRAMEVIRSSGGPVGSRKHKLVKCRQLLNLYLPRTLGQTIISTTANWRARSEIAKIVLLKI